MASTATTRGPAGRTRHGRLRAGCAVARRPRATFNATFPPVPALGHSTSTAWRPPYHPQLGQTTWGSLVWWQWGHSDWAGAVEPPVRGPPAAGSWPWGSSSWGRPSGLLNSCQFGSDGARDRQRSRGPAGRPSGGRGTRLRSRRAPSLRLAPQVGQSPATVLVAQRHEGQLGHHEVPERLLEVDLLVAERVRLLLDRVLLEDLPQARGRSRPRAARGTGCRPRASAPAPGPRPRWRPGRLSRRRSSVRGWSASTVAEGFSSPATGTSRCTSRVLPGSAEQISDVHAESGHQRGAERDDWSRREPALRTLPAGSSPDCPEEVH